jgi:hypothetical protein
LGEFSRRGTNAARQAATELHHFTDFVFKEKAPPLAFATLDAVRGAVEAKCVLLRTATPIPDVSLLRDVADAFKHHHLDRQSATIAASTDVVSMGTGFGEVAYYGEGKYGGMEQFIITKKGRPEAGALLGPPGRVRCVDDVARTAAAANERLLVAW